MRFDRARAPVLFFSFICLFANATALAQKYNIKQYTANTGLPTSNVFDIEFDDLGNIWFATYNGVVKFNGIDYTVFDEEAGLKDPVLFDLLIDDKNTLWASTEFGGVAKFENGKFVYPKHLAWIDSTIVHYMIQSVDGNYWFSLGRKGVYILDQDQKLIKKLTIDDGLPANQAWNFNNQIDSTILISTHAGLAVYNNNSQRIEKTYTIDDGLGGLQVYESLIDKKGQIWVAHNNGFSIIGLNNEIRNFEELNGSRTGYIYSFSESDDGTIWIGSENAGLFLFNDDKQTHFTIKNGLSSNNVYRIVKSKTGEIWVATDGNGVNVFIDTNFKVYDEASSLGASSIYSLYQDNGGTVWFTTEYGLNSYKDGVFEKFPLNFSEIANEQLLTSAQLPNGNIIMITNNYSLVEFDGERYFKSKYEEDFEGINTKYIKVFGETIWFAADGYLIRVESDKIEYFKPNTNNAWQEDLQYIHQDSRGLMWVASRGGLILFKNGEFNFITLEDGLSGVRISQISEDRDGNLWLVSTAGIDIISGINEYGEFEKITPFKTADLYYDKTNFLQFDSYGNMWQGTSAGLNFYSFNPPYSVDNYKHIHIPLQDYGNGAEFTNNGSLLSDDSLLYFGTYTNGLITFEYNEGETQLNYEEPPKVFIRSIIAGDEAIYLQDTDSTLSSNYSVDHSQNNILVQFNALSDKYPQRIHIRHKLEGLNNNWILAENISQIRYESLPSGTFSLVMQTKAPNSDWSEVQQVLTIKVNKPFYSRIWFISLVILVIAAIVATIMKGRITYIEKNLLKNQVDEQTQHIQKTLDEKEVLIKEIHHRVKNNLAVISGLLDLQSRQIEEGPATEALQNSMTRVLAMAKIHEQLYQNDDLANVNFKNFITNLVRSLDNTISNVEFPILINENVEDISVDVNVGVPLGLMINEILSNSFKHAFQKMEVSNLATIEIEFSQIEKSHYYLKIADNGVGAKNNLLEVVHQSLGITLIKSWASQLDSELTYNGSKGSVFEAKIPI